MKQYLLLIACLCSSSSYGAIGRGAGERGREVPHEAPLIPKKPEAPKKVEVKEKIEPEKKPLVSEQPKIITVTTIKPLPEKTGLPGEQLTNISKKFSDFVRNYVEAIGEFDEKLSYQELQKLKEQLTPENVVIELVTFNQQLKDISKRIAMHFLSPAELKSLEEMLTQVAAEASKLESEIKPPDDYLQGAKIRISLAEIELKLKEMRAQIFNELAKREKEEAERTLAGKLWGVLAPLKKVVSVTEEPKFDQAFLEQGEILRKAILELKPTIDEFYRLRKKATKESIADKSPLSEEEQQRLEKLYKERHELREMYKKYFTALVGEFKNRISKDFELPYNLQQLIARRFSKLTSDPSYNTFFLAVADRINKEYGPFYDQLTADDKKELLEKIHYYVQFDNPIYSGLERWIEAYKPAVYDLFKKQRPQIRYEEPEEKVVHDFAVEQITALINQKKKSPQAKVAAEIVADILLIDERLKDYML